MLKLFVIMERQELGSSLLKQNYFQGNTFLIIILIIQGDLQQIIKQTSDPTQGNLSGKISVINNDTMTGRFDVLISDVKAPNGVASVSVPIWSDVNGQDDLVMVCGYQTK